MEHLIFSLNATAPVFATMLLGMLFRRCGLFTAAFADRLNAFVFRAALPLLLFEELATENFYAVWDGRFVLFCLGTTLLCVAAAVALSCFVRDTSRRGEFIQGAYRSSAAILGIAFIQNMYGGAVYKRQRIRTWRSTRARPSRSD